MLHYNAIPRAERSGTAWNNLGVACARVQLKGMAVAAYMEAADRGETIADGNLAQLLQGAGFYREAQLRAETAIAKKGHDKSVVTALGSLEEAEAKEQSTYSAVINTGQARQKIRRNVGQAAIEFSGPNIVGKWLTIDGQINLLSNGGNRFVGVLEFEREVLQNALLLGKQVVKEMVRITVHLRRFGAALEGKIKRETPGKATTLLGIGLAERSLLLSISQDGQTISGFEYDHGESAVTWTRHLTLQDVIPPTRN